MVGTENFHAKIDFSEHLPADFLEGVPTSQTYSVINVSVMFPMMISPVDMNAGLSSLCVSRPGKGVRRKTEQCQVST
jgi:hypothetical protein